MKDLNGTCYLCGSQLDADVDNDHVPPKQFFGKTIRRNHSLNLLTIKVHRSCNQAYKKDEDYFVNSLMPLAMNSYAGKAIAQDIFRGYHKGHQVGLIRKIYGEFDGRPGGVYLPEGLIVKRIEGNRIHRIAWKIIRGLFFHHECKFVPENTPKSLDNLCLRAIRLGLANV